MSIILLIRFLPRLILLASTDQFMAFFDTYQTLGIATEIMGITPEGWIAIEQMQKAR